MIVRDASRLRSRIADSGLSHEQIAEAAGCSAAFISHLTGSGIPPALPGQPRCQFAWRTERGPVRCVGTDPHPGHRHASSTRPRRRSCSPDTAHRIANALRVRTDLLFDLRRPEDPSTGPLPAVRPIPRRAGRHRAVERRAAS